MPFESQAQRRFMYAKHPEMAKRWQKHTPKGADLPEHVKKASVELAPLFAKIAEGINALGSGAKAIAGAIRPSSGAVGAAKAQTTRQMRKVL